MRQNLQILDIIENQKVHLSNWRKKFICSLFMNTIDSLSVYVINKEWLDNYEEFIFKSHDESELINFYNTYQNIDNTNLFNSFDFKALPKISVLNESCIKALIGDSSLEKLKKLKGRFFYKKFIIEILNQEYNKVYAVFFLDKNNQLGQGYLSIHKLGKEKEILKNLNISNIIKDYNKKNSAKNDGITLYSNDFDLHIFESDKRKYYNNIDDKNILAFATINNYYNKNNENNLEDSRKKKQKTLKIVFHQYIRENDERNKILKIKEYTQITGKTENKLINGSVNGEKLDKKEEAECSKKIMEDMRPIRIIKKIQKKRHISAQISNKKFGKRIHKVNNVTLNLSDFLPVKSIDKISYPGIIGLQNIGATCYMNATLQCFSNVGRLKTYLLSKNIYQDLENNKNSTKKISFALAEVLNNLWEKLEHRFYAPNNFKNLISEMNPLFKGIAANDPKDLILFLLEKMHNELNSPINKIPDNSLIPNSSNFIEVYNEFVSYFESKNRSIISEEFFFFTNNISTCQYCSTMIHNTQSNNILFFPLEEVRKYKNYRHNNVTILDCFDYYRKEEIYPSFYCNICKQNYQTISQTHIIKAPKTLIINFNRGKGLEFNVNIIFEEYLNLRKYVYDKNSPYYYELTGVICHFGSNDEGGHFIAYCKNSNNCEWYKYNDQIVTKCSFNEVKGSGLPYVLFFNYVKV